MPSGRPELIAPVINYIMKMNPSSILDVGAGYGKWGLLLREYLETWQGRLDPDNWAKRVDALEVFESYTRLPWYRMIYDTVYVDNVVNRLELLDQYDLVLFLDIIEHLEKETGLGVLERAPHWVLTTPNYWNPQGIAFGNKAETHKSRWFLEDFENSRLIQDRWIFAWR